jgi:hypothetical protein
MERAGRKRRWIMKKKDFILVGILVGLILFLAFDLREGGPGISSHIAGAFRTLLFGGSSRSNGSVPASAPQTMSPSTIVAPAVDAVPDQRSGPDSNLRFEHPTPQTHKSMKGEAIPPRSAVAYESKPANESLSKAVAADNDRVTSMDTVSTSSMTATTGTAASAWEMKTRSAKKH